MVRCLILMGNVWIIRLNTNLFSYKCRLYLMFAGVSTAVFAAVVIIPIPLSVLNKPVQKILCSLTLFF